MPATIYSPPEEIGEPPSWDSDTPIQELLDSEKEYQKRIQAWCKEHGQGDYRGELWRYQIADGYAIYVIYKMRPLTLIHVATGDAWDIPEVVRRGLSAALIREDIKRSAAIAALFNRSDTA